jgi:hypothetical protein
MFTTNSIIVEKNIEKKNGKITKNIEMLGYNGNVTIQGNINDVPFLITNTIKKLPNCGVLSRTPTPLPKKSKKIAIKKIGDIAKRVKKQTRKNRKTKTKK